MDRKYIIKKTADFVRRTLSRESTGHGWRHAERVRRMAVSIARKEQADVFVVELAAMLHDIADWKFHGGSESEGPRRARRWLESLKLPQPIIKHIAGIVRDISFKGARVKSRMKTPEGRVVQDADRLDALGAVGIARTFAYGGSRGFEIHDPDIRPVTHRSFEAYKKNRGTTINHFYEKLLLLRDRMNTPSGKKMARGRHEYMKKFLARFFREWNGK